MGATSKWKSDMVVNLATTLNHGHWTDQAVTELTALLAELETDESGRHPIRGLAASKSINPDIPSVGDALSSEDNVAWTEAMRAEIKSLQARETLKIVERSQAGSKHGIPDTWSMKKRFPDGRFRSYEARWCKRDDTERRKAGHTLDNYSPVVAWAEWCCFSIWWVPWRLPNWIIPTHLLKD
jgi:hypothetical protein